MKTTQQLQDLGQSLWLDNITRDLLDHWRFARISRFLDHRPDLEPDDLRWTPSAAAEPTRLVFTRSGGRDDPASACSWNWR